MISRCAVKLLTVVLVGCGAIGWAVVGAAQVVADGSEVRINRGTEIGTAFPDIAYKAGTEFVVVWAGVPENPTKYAFHSILARRVLPTGPVEGEFVVDSPTEYDRSSEEYPAIAAHEDGSFVVVWENYLWSAVRRFSRQAGGSIRCKCLHHRPTKGPQVGCTSGRRFVVVWDDRAFPGQMLRRVFGRIFDVNGSALGGDFQAATYTTGEPFRSDVAGAPDGSFIVVWQSQFHGFDVTPAMLEKFSHVLQARGIKGVELKRADVLRLNTLPDSWNGYDLIVSAAVLEYLPRDRLVAALAGLRGFLHRDGTIVVLISREN